MSGLRPSLFGLLLCALPAAAQSKPTLIDHPLEVKTAVSDAQLAALQGDFRQLLARNSGVLLPTRTLWQSSISALKRQDCEVRNECLRQLATTAGTLYALFASIERNAAGTELTASGRVVNQDGAQVRPLVRVTVSRKGSLEDAAHEALAQLVAKLELEKLSPVLAPAVAEAPKHEDAPKVDSAFLPPPTPPPSEQVTLTQPGVAPMRAASYVAGGLAVVGAGVAIGFGVTAASDRAKLPVTGALADPGQVRMQALVNQGASVALASGVAAGVLGVAAVGMFLASSPSDGAHVAIAPTPGGGAVVVAGGF